LKKELSFNYFYFRHHFLVLGILYAPRFLLYTSDVQKADAIVLLLGPDFKARQKEVADLVGKRMADYLIIPAYHQTFRLYDGGAKQYLIDETHKASGNRSVCPHYYEDTHLELIDAKRVMSRLNIKSAIFVSSPYHMRRIKIIVSKIFDDPKVKFYFIPTSYENAPSNIWECSPADWKKLRREYSKILWFLIYSTLLQ